MDPVRAPSRGEVTAPAKELQSDVLAGLRKAANALNAAAADGLHAVVADGLLAAAAALSETRNLLHGEVASGIGVAGTGLRYAGNFLRAVTCSRCGLVHKHYDSFAWAEGHEKFDCRVIFHDSSSREKWLLKNATVEDSVGDDDVPSFVADSITDESDSITKTAK
ncbi:hypothetical protein BS78_01G343400 [Paspalum vaginatum]|nr:hypothetical protein BS78_01G343400 [Paspalum vaginatum]